MKNRIPLFLLVMLFAVGSLAFAGKPKLAHAVVAKEETSTFAQGAAQAFAVNAFKHPTKIADFTYVVGTTTYNYMWNSGGPRHVEYYNGITYLIWITGQGSSRSCMYSSFDGTNWLTPEAVISASTQPTYFSGISVWRGGVADGLAGVGAGWAGSGTSYYGIEGSPGGGSFTTYPINNYRDVEVANYDNLGTVIERNSYGRAGYQIVGSTDFGATWAIWAPVDTNLLTLVNPNVQTPSALEPPLEVSANGNIYLAGMPYPGTNTDVKPVGPLTDPDSADQWGIFKSTDKGMTWTYTRVISGGQPYDATPNFYNVFPNFAQYDMVVDNTDAVHMVTNGYGQLDLDPGVDTLFQNTFDAVYWDATNGFKSLVSFNRADTVICNTPQARFGSGVGGNNFGCSYPSISETPDGKYIFCTWTQPNWTSAGIDTNVAGFITSNIWYNYSFDGGASWHGAQPLNTTTGVIQAFSSQAHDLQVISNTPDSIVARVLYLEMPNVAGSNTGAVGPTGNMVYQEVHIGVVTGVTDPKTNVPVKFALDQNYPNPFNPTTQISFSIPRASNVKLTVYNMLGQEVSTLVNGYRTAGSYTVNFAGSKLASGVYLYSLKAGNFSDVKKMVLLK